MHLLTKFETGDPSVSIGLIMRAFGADETVAE
jgi:hypothetical protein